MKNLGVVWNEDTSVQCWEEAHGVSTVFAAVGLCVCAGVLVFMVAVLIGGAKKNLGYRTDGPALHWEFVLTVRRILLAALQVYASHRKTTGVQVGLTAIVIFTSLAIHTIFLPFEEADSEDAFPIYAGNELRFVFSEDVRKRWAQFNQHVKLNGLEAASLFMSLSLFMVAACICDERANELEVNFLVLSCFFLNSIYLLFMLYRMWYGLHHYLDIVADDNPVAFRLGSDQSENHNSWWFVKVWRLIVFKWEEWMSHSSAISEVKKWEWDLHTLPVKFLQWFETHEYEINRTILVKHPCLAFQCTVYSMVLTFLQLEC